MPKFEGNYSRESYNKTQEDEANLKQQMGNAKSADEMIEIATKLKDIEGNKQELHDAAYDEAVIENQVKIQRGELKESGSEKTMYEEAEDENKEFEKAKNINQLEEASKNLKEQLSQAKSADEMMEIAKQLKEIEEKKKEIDGGSQKEETGEKMTTIEELKSKDSEDTTKKIEEIRKKINGGEEDKNKNEAQQENPFLKYAYHDQESYQKTMKQLHNDEMNQINELVGQIENGTISGLDKFKLKELMWRNQGGMKKEEINSIWEKINGSSKKKNDGRNAEMAEGDIENEKLTVEILSRRQDWENDPKFEDLKKVFAEVHGSNHSEEINKKWEDLSSEMFSRLKTSEDFKEVAYFLKEERGAAYEKWDKLTEKEIKEASSEEEMKIALKNMNPFIGRSKDYELRKIAYEKFPSLREYFMNREPGGFYLGQILKAEERILEKGRERMADLEKNGQQTSDEYKKLHRLLVKTVDGKPILKSRNEIPDALAVQDVLRGE